MRQRPLRIGTRASALALWQTERVRARLAECGYRTERVEIRTTGDLVQDVPLARIGGRALFTKQLDDAMLDGRIDVAVHSLKDLPTSLPDGLALAAVPARHDPREALVNGKTLQELPQGTRIGTSSLRRITQVRYLRPDLDVVPLRGNVPTRVRKVEAGDGLDAALLALAGLERLGLGDKATVIDPFDVMPAPAQGALGLEIRADDRTTRAALRPLSDAKSEASVAAERTVLAALGGGCQAPVAAWVDGLKLYGRVTASDGAVQLTASAEIDPKRPAAAGETVARLLEAEGAASLLAR